MAHYLSYLTRPKFWLFVLIALYLAYFSGYTLNRHATLHSYTADLSLIDQPMWNTALGPGYFMEQTWGNRQQPRLAEHLEPILVPLSFLFFLWDNVRVLLIAQSTALALGALPVFWLARAEFARRSASAFVDWAALAVAAAYLLYPHLQAANIADFHADPFVVAPLLFAFWHATQQQWGRMWLWAALVMLTKETLPTLTAMLGLWLVLHAWFDDRPTPWANRLRNPAVRHGLGLMAVSVVWYVIATFLIVAPLARHYFGTDGPIYLANRFTGEQNYAAMLSDPARWHYLGGLLAAAAFLPLLAPDMLMLGLPVLAANLLSNFPGQFSGEQHYSAPLVAVFTIAAIYGAGRLLRWPRLQKSGLPMLSLWLLAWALGYHALHGWTPLSLRTEDYRPRPASMELPAMLAAIPPQAVTSASAGLTPHLAHRRISYTFPTVEEATDLLVDVTDIPGVHPNDAHARLLEMLTTDWQLLEAKAGLLRAQKSPAPTPPPPCTEGLPLPCPFYTFTQPVGPPHTPLALTFGDGQLTLLGFDTLDDPDNGVVFRFHWQVNAPLPDDTRLWPLVFDDTGQLLTDPAQIPMIAAVWYPPDKWPVWQTIVTETLPQLLPEQFHLGLAVGVGGDSLLNPALRLPIIAPETPVFPGRWAQLARFTRQGPYLTQLAPNPRAELTPAQATFGDSLQLVGYQAPVTAVRPGQTIPIRLAWDAILPVPADYTVFLHLLAPDGHLAAQHDATPTWLFAAPTSQWLPGQFIPDSHLLSLPDNLPPGQYLLHTGLYDPRTQARLPLPSGETSLLLTTITVE